jgi:hypothetical protein
MLQQDVHVAVGHEVSGVEAIATTEIATEAGDGVAEALPLVLNRGNALYAMLSGLCRTR